MKILVRPIFGQLRKPGKSGVSVSSSWGIQVKESSFAWNRCSS